jgi:glutamate-1-semialdehyde 2,1-aminomutase
MHQVAPLGPVYQAGTLSGNPLATAAGLTALGLLDHAAHERICATAERLAGHLRSAFGAVGIQAIVPRVDALVGLFFCDDAPTDYPSAQRTDSSRYAAFFHEMLRRGVAMAPGAYEVMFPGLAHTDAIIDEIGAIARASAAALTT